MAAVPLRVVVCRPLCIIIGSFHDPGAEIVYGYAVIQDLAPFSDQPRGRLVHTHATLGPFEFLINVSLPSFMLPYHNVHDAAAEPSNPSRPEGGCS